jgi:CBS domain-containing protein
VRVSERICTAAVAIRQDAVMGGQTDPTDEAAVLPIDLTAPQQVRAVMSTPVVTGQPDEPCRVIAQRMRSHRVSSLVIVGGATLGIVTDRDLRDRVVAADVPADSPVWAITTTAVRTTTPETPVNDVLTLMLAQGIHHVPVAEGAEPVGMVTAGDLLRARTMGPLELGERLDGAPDVEALRQALEARTAMVRDLLAAGLGGTATGRLVAALTDRVVRRLIALAEAELGPAPAAYGWLAFGSHGRREQTLHTDQDTGLLLPDGLPDEQLGWFERLGLTVTDGLAECGYPRCGGGVMASEARWRRSASSWRQRFGSMISAPTVEALLGVDIAFDVRTVAGEMDAAAELGPTIRAAQRQEIFLARLARDASSQRPPLRALGRFAVPRTGEHRGTLDVKAGAMLPIADVARLFVLARGGTELGTDDRLAGAIAQGQLSEDLGTTLRAGYDLALRLRLEAQVTALESGTAVHNRVEPAALPSFARLQLRETFKAVRLAQELLQRRYLTHLLA